MLRGLKRYSAKRQLPVFLQGNQSTSVKKSDKIGIILDLDLVGNDFDLTALRKEMDFPYAVFYPIIFSTQKSIPEKYTLEQFDRKQLSWHGRFEEGSKEQLFQETKYALLLNYFVNPAPELLVLSASVKADLKVGFPLEERRLNDLEFDIDPKDYRLFSKELKKYLGMMKT